MILQMDLVVDGRTLALLVTLLLVWGFIYDIGLAWVYRNLPPAQILLYHLIASCFGIGVTVLITVPIIGVQDAFVLFGALAIAGLPIGIGVLTRYFHPFTKSPILRPRLRNDTEDNNDG